MQGAHIAKSIYPFLENTGLIPDIEDTFELIGEMYCNCEINGKLTKHEIAAFMNVEMVQRLKKYLECNLVKLGNRHILREALTYGEFTNLNNPLDDRFIIFFQGKGYSPEIENLEVLCEKIKAFEKTR